MSCDKPSFTKRPKTLLAVREERIDEYIRGGRGNKELVGWNKGSLEEKERDIFNTLWDGLSTDNTYDYQYVSQQPKEWNNIQKGSDILKFNRKDKFTLSFIGVLLLNVLIYIVIKLVL